MKSTLSLKEAQLSGINTKTLKCRQFYQHDQSTTLIILAWAWVNGLFNALIFNITLYCLKRILTNTCHKITVGPKIRLPIVSLKNGVTI